MDGGAGELAELGDELGGGALPAEIMDSLRDILEAHRQLTCDATLRGRVDALIGDEQLDAESALQQVYDQWHFDDFRNDCPGCHNRQQYGGMEADHHAQQAAALG